jgi:hypothetical protein
MGKFNIYLFPTNFHLIIDRSFMFGRPFLNTMDMDLLRRVYIKDFSHFTNRFVNFLKNELCSEIILLRYEISNLIHL